MYRQGIKVLNKYFQLMEYEVLEIDDNVVTLYDTIEDTILEKSISSWCTELIGMLLYKVYQDSNNKEIVDGLTTEISVLTKLKKIVEE